MKHTILALALLALGCRSPIPNWLSIPETTTSNGVEVNIDGVMRGTTWLEGVTGTAKNVSGAPLTSCMITFDAYDMHGEMLGSARAKREGMEAGEEWAFKAEFSGQVRDTRTISPPRVYAH